MAKNRKEIVSKRAYGWGKKTPESLVRWKRVKNFTDKENWGNPEKIMPKLVYSLDEMREKAGVKFIIHCAYETDGHVEGSYHGLGMAVDGHFEGVNLIDQYFMAVKVFGGNAIGLYGKDVWVNPGVHIDIRPYIARWGCRIINNKREYVALDSKFINHIMKS